MDRISIYNNYINGGNREHLTTIDTGIISYTLCDYGNSRYGYEFFISFDSVETFMGGSSTKKDDKGNIIGIYENEHSHMLGIFMKINIPAVIKGVPVVYGMGWLDVDFPDEVDSLILDLSDSDLSNIISINFFDDLDWLRNKVKLILPDGDKKLRPVDCQGLTSCLVNSSEVIKNVDFSDVMIGSYMLTNMYANGNCAIRLSSIKLPNIRMANYMLYGQYGKAKDSGIGSFVERITYSAETTMGMFMDWNKTLFMDFKPFKLYVNGKHGENVMGIFSNTGCSVINLMNTEFVFSEKRKCSLANLFIDEDTEEPDICSGCVIVDSKFKTDKKFVSLFDDVITLNNPTKESIKACISKARMMELNSNLLILASK